MGCLQSQVTVDAGGEEDDATDNESSEGVLDEQFPIASRSKPHLKLSLNNVSV